jgi:hypothetical protein
LELYKQQQIFEEAVQILHMNVSDTVENVGQARQRFTILGRTSSHPEDRDRSSSANTA